MYGGYHHDRRRFQRLKVNLSVFCHIEAPEDIRRLLGGAEFEAHTLDLGEGGRAFQTRRDIPVHTILSMKFIRLLAENHGCKPADECKEVHHGEMSPRHVGGGPRRREAAAGFSGTTAARLARRESKRVKPWGSILFKFNETGVVSFNDPLEVHAQVCSRTLLGNDEYRLGVSFKRTEQKGRCEICDFVSATQRPSTVF